MHINVKTVKWMTQNYYEK